MTQAPLPQPASPDPATNAMEMRMAWLSLIVGASLMSMKFFAYFLTHSSAIFSDGMENVVNVLASGFAVFALRLAHRPADQDHPYGHGKIEFMSAGFEGGMILLAVLLIATRAVVALATEQQPNDLVIGQIITLISTAICGATGLVLRRQGNRHGSITLQADGVHLLSDAITGVMVLIALQLVRWTGLNWIDPVAALLISVWLAWQALRLLRQSAAGLMDEQDKYDSAILTELLQRHVAPTTEQAAICSFHKLRHRHSGRHHLVDFHIQVPGDINVVEGHHIATTIEMEIERTLVDCSATAHVEPCLARDCGRCGRKEMSPANSPSSSKSQ